MDKMRKITNRMLGTDDKMVKFRWITECIATYGDHATWFGGGIYDSQ